MMQTLSGDSGVGLQKLCMKWEEILCTEKLHGDSTVITFGSTYEFVFNHNHMIQIGKKFTDISINIPTFTSQYSAYSKHGCLTLFNFKIL
jgi:hypothetical protein